MVTPFIEMQANITLKGLDAVYHSALSFITGTLHPVSKGWMVLIKLP